VAKFTAQFAIGILLTQSAPIWGQQITGRSYPEKENYLVGEPIFVVLDLTNAGPESVSTDDGSCTTTFEPATASQPREVSLYGCAGGGVVGDCMSGLVRLGPGEHFKRRFLLDGAFRLDSPGVYSIRGRHSVQIYSNAETWQFLTTEEIISDFEVLLIQGDESELASAYEPILRDLRSPDPAARSLAVSAITQNPPGFLENVILGLADDPQTAAASIAGLKRLATPQAKAKLGQLAGAASAESVRQEAVTALGELGDPSYCRLIVEIAQSGTEYSRLVALRAAGFVCGKAALPTLLGLFPSANPSLRFELAYALGNSHVREAVPPLISLLVDHDQEVRRGAAEALATLTHRTSTRGIGTEESARQAHSEWVRWWSFNGSTAPLYSPRHCDGLQPID